MLQFPVFCNSPVSTTVIKCPLGLMHLQTCTAGVHSLEFQSSDLSNASTDRNVSIEQSAENLNEPASVVITWLQSYFQSPPNMAKVRVPTYCFVPQSSAGGRFADRVLSELIKIGFGERVSYGELARRAGNEKASRAVGQVMHSNPVCLIIPCHRVVLKSGAFGHYGGGKKDEIKAWLLKYELKNTGDGKKI